LKLRRFVRTDPHHTDVPDAITIRVDLRRVGLMQTVVILIEDPVSILIARDWNEFSAKSHRAKERGLASLAVLLEVGGKELHFSVWPVLYLEDVEAASEAVTSAPVTAYAEPRLVRSLERKARRPLIGPGLEAKSRLYDACSEST